MLLILENLRSAYNVWNIIRTADAFWYDIIISGYTPSPFTEEKVRKTSLGAENTVNIKEFWNTKDALDYAANNWYKLIWAEITDNSISLIDFVKTYKIDNKVAIIFGNEVDWVLKETLDRLNYVVHIPMNWIKESLNVWQAAAIFMREFYKLFK